MEFQNICNEMVAPFLLRHTVRQSDSVGVGRMFEFEYVCLLVCLFFRSITQKQMIHCVLDIRNELGHPI